MGRLGKQCLIETHSEYLVNKLRQRIVEAKSDEVLQLVRMYFVERKGNASSFREVTPNQYGALLEWPDGFFDEGTLQAETIMRLATQKRRNVRLDRVNEDPH
jgi:predicted ATPase